MTPIEKEEFYISLDLGQFQEIKYEEFTRVLNYLDNSFLHCPVQLYVLDKPPVGIDTFKAPMLMKSLKALGAFELEDNLLNIGFSTIGKADIGISMNETYIQQNCTTNDLKKLLLDLMAITSPSFAVAWFQKINDEIDEKYFEDTEHEDVPLLKWLNYFGKEEFAKRGGEALYDNPYIKVEKMGEGVLVQVGESPYDAYTPEGEALLVKASLVMPPYKRR